MKENNPNKAGVVRTIALCKPPGILVFLTPVYPQELEKIISSSGSSQLAP